MKLSISRSQQLALATVAIVVVVAAWWAAISSIRAADAPDGFSTDAGDTQVRSSWDNPNDYSITGCQVSQAAISQLVGPSTYGGDRFGESVAVVGGTEGVGFDSSSDDSGAADGHAWSSEFRGWTAAIQLTAFDVQDRWSL